MKEYEVTAYYSQVIRVNAENENDAISKAQSQLQNINTSFVADGYEAVELDY